jgi:hypothetical protein
VRQPRTDRGGTERITKYYYHYGTHNNTHSAESRAARETRQPSLTYNIKMPERRTASSVTSNNSNTSNGRARPSRQQRDSTARNKDGGRRFHPNLITAQIVSLQCFQYLAQSILFQLNALIYKSSTATLDRIFTDKYVHLWKAQGWPDCAAIFLAALVGYVSL